MPDKICVRMLGGFSIERSGNHLDDHSNRMRKVWLLLAYLIYTRNESSDREKFLELAWEGGGDDSNDPNGRLKAMFYRARTMLNSLGDGTGHELIVRRSGSYAWNTDVPLWLDVEEFERLCAAGAEAKDDQARLELWLQALELYRGDFLPKLAMEHWVTPISAYYHRMYLDTVRQTASILQEQEKFQEAAACCEKALKIEPYNEPICQHLMQCRIALGDRAGAVRAYEEMSELLFSAFGVMPSEESARLFRDASRETENVTISATAIHDWLREPEAGEGAVYCERDFFKMLYQVQARAIVRSGEVIHIALISLEGKDRKELARRSLNHAMDNLQELVVSSLRRGDVVARCSVSQFIVMLYQANYEDSCTVCQRIVWNFARRYPHSPAEVRYRVQPLEPLS